VHGKKLGDKSPEYNLYCWPINKIKNSRK